VLLRTATCNRAQRSEARPPTVSSFGWRPSSVCCWLSRPHHHPFPWRTLIRILAGPINTARTSPSQTLSSVLHPPTSTNRVFLMFRCATSRAQEQCPSSAPSFALTGDWSAHRRFPSGVPRKRREDAEATGDLNPYVPKTSIRSLREPCDVRDENCVEIHAPEAWLSPRMEHADPLNRSRHLDVLLPVRRQDHCYPCAAKGAASLGRQSPLPKGRGRTPPQRRGAAINIAGQGHNQSLYADLPHAADGPTLFDIREAMTLYSHAKTAPPINPSTRPHRPPMRLPSGVKV